MKEKQERQHLHAIEGNKLPNTYNELNPLQDLKFYIEKHIKRE